MPKGKNNFLEVTKHFEKIDVENSALVQNFKDGDLLYGFKDVRSVFRPHIEKRITSKNITIDDYNNPLLHKFLDDDYYFLLNLKDADIDTVVKSLAEVYLLDEAQQKYITYILSQEKFSPRNEEMKPKLEKRKSDADHREEVKLRRLCKAALTWPQKTIHFCLDTLNEDQAITKWNREENKIDNGFTDAELRWLYKNWEKVKDKVIFYKNGEQTEAPWAGEKATSWAENYKKGSFYVQQMAEEPEVKKAPTKGKGKNKRSFTDFEDDVEENSPKKRGAKSKPNRNLFSNFFDPSEEILPEESMAKSKREEGLPSLEANKKPTKHSTFSDDSSGFFSKSTSRVIQQQDGNSPEGSSKKTAKDNTSDQDYSENDSPGYHTP
ncbi:MAG: hypothetical protein WBE18_01210 [Gammaproteobacteria bacterium]